MLPAERFYRQPVAAFRRAWSQVERRRDRLRYEYWKQELGAVGWGTHFYGSVHVIRPHRVFVGNRTTFNQGVTIVAREPVIIGDHCRLSTHVVLHTTGLLTESRRPPYQHYARPIVIQDGVWLGSGVQVMPGVTVGHHSVVAAGAVVTKDLPPHSLAGGVPAEPLKQDRREGAEA
jgi:acetyltransferase-like isoleucine patch superfamily enzyme